MCSLRPSACNNKRLDWVAQIEVPYLVGGQPMHLRKRIGIGGEHGDDGSSGRLVFGVDGRCGDLADCVGGTIRLVEQAAFDGQRFELEVRDELVGRWHGWKAATTLHPPRLRQPQAHPRAHADGHHDDAKQNWIRGRAQTGAQHRINQHATQHRQERGRAADGADRADVDGPVDLRRMILCIAEVA